MDESAFRSFLKKGGRSPSAAGRVIGFVREFEEYLAAHGRAPDEASPSDLESYVADIEAEPGESAKLNLWGLRYYYEYLDDPIMVHMSATMRRERVERTPFRLRRFRGVDQSHTDRLSAIGIGGVDDLLAAAALPNERKALAGRAGIPIDAVEELVRLADLARIPGLKGIRARLYLDAGVSSVAELADWDPEDLVAMLRRYVEESDFDGIAPLPAEARHAVATAKGLPPVVAW